MGITILLGHVVHVNQPAKVVVMQLVVLLVQLILTLTMEYVKAPVLMVHMDRVGVELVSNAHPVAVPVLETQAIVLRVKVVQFYTMGNALQTVQRITSH